MLKAHLLSRPGRPPWAGRAARCRGNSPKRAAAALKGAEGAGGRAAHRGAAAAGTPVLGEGSGAGDTELRVPSFLMR